jgi:hypothetical protein
MFIMLQYYAAMNPQSPRIQLPLNIPKSSEDSLPYGTLVVENCATLLYALNATTFITSLSAQICKKKSKNKAFYSFSRAALSR